ncbi:MAG TPA: proline/glycine betaine ABC transporter ATP-binding protein, partial [Pseudomonas sp.]|nr:proline/glycine betaine ABC transporter ATP-binding protein [Pseudomonas sp.]
MQLLTAGASKDRILAETATVVGLNNVSLSIPSGAIYMIMGLSGSGKSTLARCINRLNEPTAGKILLDGRDLVTLNENELRDVRRTRISMVFQHFALLPNKTVIENTEFGLKLQGVDKETRRARARRNLELVGLKDFHRHMIYQLSGGMQQRVLIAIALAGNPRLIIAD